MAILWGSLAPLLDLHGGERVYVVLLLQLLQSGSGMGTNFCPLIGSLADPRTHCFGLVVDFLLGALFVHNVRADDHVR